MPGLRAYARRLAAGAALLLAGCAVEPWVDEEMAWRPPRVELAGVPFHAQREYQCGPAALAMVFAAAGVERSPDELAADVYLPGRQGSLQLEMLAATRRHGLLPYVLPPRLGAILDEVAVGNPVVVLQRPGFGPLPGWHYAVVVGYDLTQRDIFLRSGGERRRRMDVVAFQHSWKRAGRWAFVALAPGRLPATANEQRVVEAAAALEPVAPAAAGRVYAAVLDRWPGNLAARLGQGNAAWRQHEPARAAVAFQRAVEDHPAAADAWNNLALALHESGRRREAVAAARRAVQAGGSHAARYAATLAEVSRGLAAARR